MALLYRVRDGADTLKCTLRRSGAVVALVVAGFGLSACSDEGGELAPDPRIQRELGLGPRDRVHTVTLRGGEDGGPDPDSVLVSPGEFAQFVSGDWWVHEVVFEEDSLSAAALGFTREHDQLASPPLVSRGARFVVSFVDAPPGRYPYRLEGNGPATHGVVVVAAPRQP